jgi:opacity protein-like surface antigen
MKAKMAAAFLMTSLASSVALADSDLGGFYVGANIGMGAPSMTVEDSDCWYDCSAYTQRPTGMIYGVQGGQNIVSGNMLLGWSLDYNAGSLDETYNYGYGLNPDPNSQMVIKSEFKSVMSLRVKAGLLVGDTAVAINFGPARGKFETSFSDHNNQSGNPAAWDTATKDGNSSGFVYGVSVEHTFMPNVLVSADISKYSFDTENTTVIRANGTDSGSKIKIVNSLDTFRIGASYKF